MLLPCEYPGTAGSEKKKMIYSSLRETISMKPSRRVSIPAFLFFGLFFVISSCEARQGFYAKSVEADGAFDTASPVSRSPAYAAAGGTEMAASGVGPAEPASAETIGGRIRRLIKNAELRVRVDNPAASEKSLADLMAKYDAWSSSTTVYENSREYTLRVPAASYEDFLAGVAGLGRVLRRTEGAEDVTLQYYDLEGRLATKQELLKTFRDYLGRAKDIDEIMTVEKRIAELQQEIDWTGTQLRNLAYLVDYSTIELEILGPASVSSYQPPTLGDHLGGLFGSFGETASRALVVIIGVFIYGVPALLIVVLLFWILFGRIGLVKKLWLLAAGKKKD
jgi:hypothetical protein